MEDNTNKFTEDSPKNTENLDKTPNKDNPEKLKTENEELINKWEKDYVKTHEAMEDLIDDPDERGSSLRNNIKISKKTCAKIIGEGNLEREDLAKNSPEYHASYLNQISKYTNEAINALDEIHESYYVSDYDTYALRDKLAENKEEQESLKKRFDESDFLRSNSNVDDIAKERIKQDSSDVTPTDFPSWEPGDD